MSRKPKDSQVAAERPCSGIPTWAFELALRVKYHGFGPARFEEVLARADSPAAGWSPASDHEYLCASLAHEVLATPVGGLS